MTSRGSRSSLAGVGTLLRFMVRRDRIRLLGWVGGITALQAYFAVGLAAMYPDEKSLEGIAALWASPIAALFTGRGSPGALDIQHLVVTHYGLFISIFVALMAILTVTRHTRAEEQAGRTELIRGNVVGRNSQLAAALVLTFGMCAALGVLIPGVLVGQGYGATGAVCYGLSVAACGLAFSGITAACVQVFEFSRAGSGLAGACLGFGFAIRGLGDMSAVQDGGLGWLSWLTPLGWSQFVGPLEANNLAPLLLSVACCLLGAWAAHVLAGRRDLGAGLRATKLGSPRAGAWLGTPQAAAFRFQRAGLLGWGACLFTGGAMYGMFAQVMTTMDNMPSTLVDIMGGQGRVLNGYICLIGMMMGVTAAIQSVLAVQGLRAEESSGRLESVLSTPVSRRRWLGSWAGVNALGALGLLLVTGLGLSLGVGFSTHSLATGLRAFVSTISCVPAIWVILAVALFGYAVRPGLVGAAWAL
ncbi:MAG: ABC transporter permease, partial [Micrococcales bacterium]|nr:ABC transporter permease [Micrococcales bacterium]